MSFVRPFLRSTSNRIARKEPAFDAAPPVVEPEIVDVPAVLAAPQPDAKTVLEMLNHAAEAIDHLQARCREIEQEAEAAAARSAQTVAEAHALAQSWEARAGSSDLLISELETRLAEADQTAMELRSRLVCLYGKLAASSDTVRFRTLSRALVGGMPSELGAPLPAWSAPVE